MSTFSFFISLAFAGNCFLAGYFFGQDFEYAVTKREKVNAAVLCTVMFCFGTAIYAGVVIVSFVKYLIREINERIQIHFWITFYFTKKWNSVDGKKLIEINYNAKKHRNTNSLWDKIYRKCTELINKRNKYVYNGEKPEYELE